MDQNKLQDNLLKYAHLAVNLINNSTGHVIVNQKTSIRDLVTNIDKLVEQKIIDEILIDYPGATIISEEYHHQIEQKKLTNLTFFVDPIDGTMNFVNQHDHFATMIGVYWDSIPLGGIIVDVTNNNYYYGTNKTGIFKNGEALTKIVDKKINEGLLTVSSRFVLNNSYNVNDLIKKSLGLRITGSAGISFAELLDKKIIGYISKLAPWDIAAGKFLAEGLGYVVTKIDGTPPTMLKSEKVIISTKQLHEIAIEHLHD